MEKAFSFGKEADGSTALGNLHWRDQEENDEMKNVSKVNKLEGHLKMSHNLFNT